jgi:hypothetical protein
MPYRYTFIDSVIKVGIAASPHTTPQARFPSTGARWAMSVEADIVGNSTGLNPHQRIIGKPLRDYIVNVETEEEDLEGVDEFLVVRELIDSIIQAGIASSPHTMPQTRFPFCGIWTGIGARLWSPRGGHRTPDRRCDCEKGQCQECWRFWRGGGFTKHARFNCVCIERKHKLNFPPPPRSADQNTKHRSLNLNSSYHAAENSYTQNAAAVLFVDLASPRKAVNFALDVALQ